MTKVTHGLLILAAALLGVIALDSLENRIAAVEAKIQSQIVQEHDTQIAALQAACASNRRCR